MVAVTLLAARLAAYEPDGPRFATALLDPSSWDATFAFNDAGSLQVKYARDLDPIGMLGRPVELAAELWDGTTWVEPRNARYVATEDQSDDAADLDVASYTLKSYATLLNRVQVLARPDNPVFPDTDRPDYTDDGSREFWTATAGQVVLSLLNEHRQRYGTLPALTVDFTSTHDSAGQPWAEVRSLTYSPSTGLFDVLADLASYSLIDWWMEGRTLRVLNAGTQQVDRTVRMHLVDAESAPVRGSWDGMATVVRLEGVDGQAWEKAVPGAPAWWGPRVRTIVNSSVADDATAQAILENEALLAAAKRTEYTRTLKDFKQRPLLDFQVGDTIPAKNALGVFEQMRVFEIGLSLDTDGLLSSTLTLNDRFVDADVRFQRRLKGATSGADDVGGDGSIPNNLTPAVPAQVKGLTVGTLGYWKGAVPRSSVQADWADVTADVNGYAIELLRYDVEVSGRTTAVPAADIGQRPPSQVGVTNLDIDTPVVVRVRAVSATGVPGAWSASVSIVTDRPYMPMDPPTVFVPTAENGIVTVSWDGMLRGSGNPYSPPSYFDRVDVYESELSSGPWTRVGTIRAGMLVLDRQSVLGESRFYRGVAVDVLGTESDPSTSASVVVTSWISEQVADARQKAAQAGQDAQAAKTQAQSAIETATARLAPPIRSASAPSGSGTSVGQVWWQYATAALTGAIKGQWVWSGTAWVPTPLASSVLESVVADIIVGGTGSLDQAFIGQLVGDDAFLKSLYSNRVVVSPDNMIRDPGFADATINAARSSRSTGAWFVSDNPNDADMPTCFRINSAGAADQRLLLIDGPYSDSEPYPSMPVSAGTKIRFSCGVRTDAGVIYQIVAYIVRADGTMASNGFGPTFRHATTGRADVSYEWTVPTDAVRAFMVFRVLSTGATGSYLMVGKPKMTPMVGTVLIEDGAVNGDKFTMDEGFATKFWASEANFGKITTQMFSTQAAFEGPGVRIDRTGVDIMGSGQAGIFADAVNGLVGKDSTGVQTFRVAMDGSVTLKGSLTAGSTITGATVTGGVVRTAASGERVEMNSSGLRVVDASGTDLVRLGYGQPTGMSIRNPRDGGFIPLSEAAFGQRVTYAAKTDGSADFQDAKWSGTNDSVYIFAFDSTYDPTLTFTTTSSGQVIIDISGLVGGHVYAADGNTSRLWIGWGWELLVGSTVVMAVSTGRSAKIDFNSVTTFSSSDVEGKHMLVSAFRRYAVTLDPNKTYTLRARRWKLASSATTNTSFNWTRARFLEPAILVTTDGY